MILKTIFLLLLYLPILGAQDSVSREVKITSKYLNIPVSMDEDRSILKILSNGNILREFAIRISNGVPDYWVFVDMTEFQDQTISLDYPKKASGIDQIYQANTIAGSDSLYKEKNRPQFHFTSKRGWNNDPNGLVYYDNEYHLFYQHNPYEIHWENMHWGHAVSNDLLHWKELGEALYPDDMGTIFSGTVVVDSQNTSGFQTGKEKPMIAAYTAHSRDNEVQCIAFSNDKGRTWSKYYGNPILDTKIKWNSKNLRDPKVFWHRETSKWVMVLFEKNGHSFYTSDDLKSWKFQSHLGGFWECPELFELSVDGDPKHTKWVLYGASGTYAIGDFNGKEFSIESGKHQYFSGKMYAAQTFNNIPKADGRRIQIGWGQISHPGMPFNQMMLFPTELTLRSGRNGIRMYSEPIREISKLHKKSALWSEISLDRLNDHLAAITSDLLHLKMKIEIVEGIRFSLNFRGNEILHYSMNHNTLNGEFYESDQTQERTIYLEILIDKTSLEVFADHGKFSVIQELDVPTTNAALKLDDSGSKIKIHHFEIHELQSIWR